MSRLVGIVIGEENNRPLFYIEKEPSKMDEVIKKPKPGDIENMIVDWVVNWIIVLQEREEAIKCTK